VTHLKIVVNHYGTWLPDFGPQYIFELAKLVPNLEEITLDQLAMPDVAPLPGEMVSVMPAACGGHSKLNFITM